MELSVELFEHVRDRLGPADPRVTLHHPLIGLDGSQDLGPLDVVLLRALDDHVQRVHAGKVLVDMADVPVELGVRPEKRRSFVGVSDRQASG